MVAFGAGTGDNAGMVDTLDVAQSLRDAQFPDAQAAAIAKAVGQASEHGDHVTRDQFKAGLSELRLEIAAVREGLREEIAGVRAEVASVRTEVVNVEKRLVRWLLVIAGVFLAIQRLWPA